MLSLSDITAVIVTRGNVDLQPILDSLPYDDVIIWNDMERGSAGCFGRYLAADESTRPVIYFQDDDLLFTKHHKLMESYDPSRMVVNMPSPWYELCDYGRMRQALVGAGSLVPKGIYTPALAEYLSEYPMDDLFLTYCDVVVGMLTPHLRLDLGYYVYDYASKPGRIYTEPGAKERKFLMQERVMEIRHRLEVCGALSI